MRFHYLILFAFFCSCQQLTTEKISFNQDVRPILNEKCLSCHGGVKANGGFSLLFEKEALDTTASGLYAIIPGDHRNSELYRRITSKNPEERMPFEKPPLSQEEIDILAQWIDQGANWEKPWAYYPVKTTMDPPEMGSKWTVNAIDQFVLSKMKEKGLNPSPEADKATLLRRLYLDLTGLPPTREEAMEFMEDPDPDAYEKLVDRLLASPHFGERWATMWLDLARYADSKGYEKDTNREIWKFRDWVVSAFNADMPYDRFSIEQLAGDLLPNPTEGQLIATAFHRNTLANDEGGTDNEEFRVAAVIDRVATTYEVWQGTTMACVQCHSHPFDPIRQKEYYESMAYFNNTADKDAYYELPKLFTYSDSNAVKTRELINKLKKQLYPADQNVPEGQFLFDQKDSLLRHLGYRVVEAETYDESSPFIELATGLELIDQVQDGSWLRYDDVNLTDVVQVGITASTRFAYAGDIELRIDSLGGLRIGKVRITNASKPEVSLKEYKVAISTVVGKHDLYLKFSAGETLAQHLFSIDKIIYYERNRRMDKYDTRFKKDLELLASIPTTSTPIMQELKGESSRKTFVFERGSWLNPGGEVRPGIPDIFEVDPSSEPSDRLEFAQWLVSDENPLSARVAVNRFWEQLFGNGLVETLEDFGTQGSPPSHPELLDWLAMQFTETHEWKVKPLLREMVLSATYRQSSDVDMERLEKDPQNKWLSRAPRVRLSAEQIRDQILAVSGLLVRTVGGPSVSNRDVNGGWRGVPPWAIQGEEGMNRRSLYTLWKRVTPPMGMITFDSPDRSMCTSRRVRTNTPLQALNLLNDETFYEAAGTLARKMLSTEGGLDKQLNYGYQLVMSRELDEQKRRLLEQLYEDALEEYAQSDDGDGWEQEDYELAAMTIVCNALLNLDEFIVKG